MDTWKSRAYASRPHGVPHHDQQTADRRDYVRRYRRFLPTDSGAPILDVGCGTGVFVEALKRMGYTCVEGVDATQSQVAAATSRGVSGISLGAATDYLRNESARYEVITAFSVLEHQTPAELFDLLDAIRRALRPGGLLIAVVPNAKGLFGANVRFADITHELSFTPESVAQICAVTGLDVVAIQEHGPLVRGFVSGARWVVWQIIRGVLLMARIAEGGDWRARVFTQDLVFVARRPRMAKEAA